MTNGEILDQLLAEAEKDGMSDIIERLRTNAKSEDCLTDMDPDLLYAAADEIERLRAEVEALQERRCEICGYAEHHREHTGCLRTQLAAAQATIEQMRDALKMLLKHHSKPHESMDGMMISYAEVISAAEKAIRSAK